jgi:hypothetical protein
VAKAKEAIGLGDEVKCTITGYRGIVTSLTVFLYGCTRIQVQPQKLDKEGKLPAGEWLDAAQCEKVPRGRKVLGWSGVGIAMGPAGPRPDALRAKDAKR